MSQPELSGLETGEERNEIYYSRLSQWAVSDNDDEYLLDKYLPKSGSDCLRFSPGTWDPLEERLLLLIIIIRIMFRSGESPGRFDYLYLRPSSGKNQRDDNR